MENTVDPEVQNLRDQVAAAALNAAHLSLHLHAVKIKCEAFVRGVSATSWQTHEPRVIGFKAEFDEMVTALAMPDPQQLTAAHMAAMREAKVLT